MADVIFCNIARGLYQKMNVHGPNLTGLKREAPAEVRGITCVNMVGRIWLI